MKLYEIDAAIENFVFDVDEETGEVGNFGELEALHMERDKLIENLVLMVKNLNAESNAISEELKSLSERKTLKDKKLERLKNYIQSILAGAKFETPRCKISYRKSQKVVVQDGFENWARNNAPELLTEKTTVEPNKRLIKDALESGREIVGANLVENVNMSVS